MGHLLMTPRRGKEKHADPFRSFFIQDQSPSSGKIITKLREKPGEEV